MFGRFFELQYEPCPECGASVASAGTEEHVCEHERRLDYQMLQLREEIGRFEREAGAYLASAHGRFELWYAARERGDPAAIVHRVIRFYRFPYSTNVERVALALAHKGLPVESVVIDPSDRSPVRRVSGQDLVPVIEDDGTVVCDSMAIVRYLEERHPEKPLYPQDPARLAEMLVFIDWFNRVWKRPPNEIEAELSKPDPDPARLAALGKEMADALDLFEQMLAGRDYLMGAFSAADCAAFPFLKYALIRPVSDDTELFHKILVDYQPLGDEHPRIAAWIRRVDEHPRV